jgi:DHA1 family tetracycline resistance protein-like MFS transporter
MGSEAWMSPLLIAVAIVLVDLLGFSIVMPLLPRYADDLGFSDTQIGLLLAAFPMCQLVAGPILGRLSDRLGRRPVLAFSQAGTAISFLILGLSRQYWLMLLARMLDGFSGGNILVAQAYVADVTTPENRARGYGMIGAAFGLGFVLGPFLGGLLLAVPFHPSWRLQVPFLVAAGFSTAAWVLVLWRLPESLPGALNKQGLTDSSAHAETGPAIMGRPVQPGRPARVLSWRGVVDVVSEPKVGSLVALGALTVLSFAALEGTFSLYLKGRMHWTAAEAAFGFAFLGVVSALVQGGLIRRLVPRFGEPRLILTGLFALGMGMAGLALARGMSGLLAATLLVGVGQGLASPSIQALLSRVAPPTEQGAIFGTMTSAQTLARMINYLLANRLLGLLGAAAPFWEGAAIAFVALGLAAWTVLSLIGLDRERVDAATSDATSAEVAL